MVAIIFDEIAFNVEVNECRKIFFRNLSNLLKEHKKNRTEPTIVNQANLDASWNVLTVSLNVIKDLKLEFISKINILSVKTHTLDDDIRDQISLNVNLKRQLNELSVSKETSIGMLDGSKTIRTHVLYGNYLLTLICIFMIVMLIKMYRNIKPSN